MSLQRPVQSAEGAGAVALLAVDIVAFSIAAGELQVLLTQRRKGPHAQSWALPGSVVRVGEELERAALRALHEETQLVMAAGPLEQLYTFGALGRDPRGRVISVAHMVIVGSQTNQTPESSPAAPVPASELQASGLQAGWHSAHTPPPLAFDHAEILALALERLRQRLLLTLAFEFLPETFTLPELQSIHEAVLNVALDKRNFRKRMLLSGALVPAGERRSGIGRPAQLYRRKRGAL